MTHNTLGTPGPRPVTAGDAKQKGDGWEAIVVELDFATKQLRSISAEEAPASIEAERFVWLDLDFSAAEGARRLLASLGLVSEPVLQDIFSGEPGTQLAKYEDYLHLIVTGCRLDSSGLILERVDVIIGERFLLTVHAGPRIFLESVRKMYRTDFVRFAKTPSFLLYELWDALIEHYVSVQHTIEKRVDALQRKLFADVDDGVFTEVAKIGVDLLHFRSLLTPARAVLTEISTRRTDLISQDTQAFLANMVGAVERLIQDVLVDRDSLAQATSLNMSLMGHRTNRSMNKLTVISTIFLPLTFLCGVYGMNFEVFPEIRWQYGYAMFWVIVIVGVSVLLALMKRNRLL